MRIMVAVVIGLVGFGVVQAQRTATAVTSTACEAKTTAAYAELVLRKVALQADLEGSLATMARDNPAVTAKQSEIDAVSAELDQLCKVPRAKQVYLNENYAKLLLHKVELAGRLKSLLVRYTPEHPEVKRTQAELNALVREMAKIMD